jgi:hypothetical protein
MLPNRFDKLKFLVAGGNPERCLHGKRSPEFR